MTILLKLLNDVIFYVFHDINLVTMKKIKWILFGLIATTLSACSSLPSSSSNPHPGKQERVGILLVQDCKQSENCLKYSLLGSGMQSRSVVLIGNIEPSLKGKLIAVLGEELPEKDGLEAIKVEKTRAITDFDYQPFLAQAISAYTQQQYGCQSLWDQNYAWQLDGRQPMLIVVLRHPSMDGRSLRLGYDGLTKGLVSAKATPENITPCPLN